MSVLIVTGGSRGIGRAICAAAGRAGSSVIVNHSNSPEAADAVVDEIRANGGQAVAVQADVSDEASVSQMMDRAESEFGPLTGLVNNAGIMGSSGPVDDIDVEATHRMFQVNLLAPFICCKQALLRMAKRHGGHGGAIVNISGQAALHGGVGSYVDLAVSKAALDRLTRSLAQEQGAEGVRVNAVRPGVIMTEGNAAWEKLNPGWAESIISKTPLGRAGELTDVSAAVLWLLSDAASFV
ncbi:MAG TPA: SDR family oxidoreductase, partial [Kiloniellaceae bacterium]|nr:SDR family oxidoreductase [Kiloniellaceae bacterium]